MLRSRDGHSSAEGTFVRKGINIGGCYRFKDDSPSRMERAWLSSIDAAIRKARSSVLFEAETQIIWEVCKPGAQAHGLELTNDGLVTFGRDANPLFLAHRATNYKAAK